jgi:hypothetical protein
MARWTYRRMISMNAPCIVCTHILSLQRPVLLISNGGGHLQMSCGLDDHDFDQPDFEDTPKDATIVHIKHMINLDGSTKEIFALPKNWSAERRDLSAPWTRYFDPDDPE